MTNSTGDHVDPTKPILSNVVYDFLKNAALIYLPAIGVFYAAVAIIWGLPEPEKVLGTISALAVLIAAFLKISNKSYNASDAKFDGELKIEETETGPAVKLDISTPYEDFESKGEITLKVKPLA